MATMRCAVGSPDGPKGTVWRIWTSSKGDIYLAGRATAGEFKASLHRSGRWLFAATKKNVEGPKPLVDPRGDRALDKWQRPPEFAPGLTHAVQISTAGIDVDCPPTKSAEGKIEWVGPPTTGEIGTFDLILSRLSHGDDEWPGKEIMGTRPIFNAHLPTGEIIWLLWRVERATEAFWITREQAVRQHLPPRGQRPDLDEPTPTSRAILGGEVGGRALLLDVSMTAWSGRGYAAQAHFGLHRNRAAHTPSISSPPSENAAFHPKEAGNISAPSYVPPISPPLLLFAQCSSAV